MSDHSVIHKRPFFVLAILLASGILLSWYIRIPIYLLLVSALIFLTISLFSFKKHPMVFLFALLSLFICLAMLRGNIAFYFFPKDSSIVPKSYLGFHGRIIETQSRLTGSERYLVEADSLLTPSGWIPVNRQIYLTAGKGMPVFRYGDVIRSLSEVRPPALPANPGAFNMRRYLNLKDIFLQARLNYHSKITRLQRHRGILFVQEFILPARHYLSQTINRNLQPETASVIRALLLGQRQDINRDVLQNFQRTGVVHVLAISGLHVGFIVLIVFGVLSLLRVPSRWRLLILTVFLLFFIILVNFKAPVMRASLMIVLLLAGREMARPQDSLQILGLAAWILLLIQPQQLLMPGFQFSFAAVGGLLLGTPKLKKHTPSFPAHWRPAAVLNKYIRIPFLASVCAVLATLPLTWYYYGMVQTGAVFINLIIIPYIGLVVMLSIIMLAMSAIPGMPVAGLAWIIDQMVHYMLLAIAHVARIPLIYLQTAQPDIYMPLLIFILLIALYFIPHKNAFKALTLSTVFILLHIATTCCIDDKPLKVTFINVGQGDAALIEFPNGKNMLTDGGDRNFSFDAGSYYVTPFLRYKGISHINYLLGTHPHSDHIGGFISVIQNFNVDTLILNTFIVHSKLYKKLLQTARKHHVIIRHLQSGDRLNADTETRIYILHPTDRFEKGAGSAGEKINNSSIVFKLVYGETSFLFTGDAQGLAEKAIDRYGRFLKSDVLKVGHHGSLTSSAFPFLKQVRPKYAVISVGRHNKFHHPGKKTLRRLSRFKADVLRTDRVGALLFESNGQRVRLLRWH